MPGRTFQESMERFTEVATATHNAKLWGDPMTLGKWEAEVRARFAPAGDDPRGKDERCERCGEWFRRWKGRKRILCPACAALKQGATQVALITKSGPIYEKYVRAQLTHWRAEADRLCLDV